MKIILLLTSLILFSCSRQFNEKNTNDNNDSTGYLVTTSVDSLNNLAPIEGAKCFVKKNYDGYIEDTLILDIDTDIYEISPTGLFRINNADSIQLATELIVDKAYLYLDDYYFYIFFTETDFDGATSWIQKIEKKSLSSIYTNSIWGFNISQPIIHGEKVYVTAIGFIGRLNLLTGEYDWKHDNLYDHEKYSFNSFDTIIINRDQIEFLSRNYHSYNMDKVLVDSKSGNVIEIIK